MADPIAVCIEDLRPSNADRRYLRCVALVGHDPGLGFDDQGRVCWRSDANLACELLVTLDGRLALWRRPGSERVVVTRAQRSLEVPVEKPVILLHEDELSIGGRPLKIHVHGVATAAVAPEYLIATRPRRALFRSAATAVVVGASLAASTPGVAQQGPPIEVRDQPPAPPFPPPSPDASPGLEMAVEPDGGVDEASVSEGAEGGPGDVDAEAQPIEVRDQPPAIAEPPPPAGCCTHQPGAATATPWWRKKM
jgi:hypothetical protein